MYIRPNIKSSYKKNNIGDSIHDIVMELAPHNVVEFGVLNGYSTVIIAHALKNLGGGKLTSYDLFDEYPYNHGDMDKVQKVLKRHRVDFLVTLKKGVFPNIEEDFDLLHLDISNDGNTILHAIEHFPDKDILFEGGTQERDEVDWMKKYNKRKIYPLKDEIGYEIIDERFPGLSLIRGKK